MTLEAGVAVRPSATLRARPTTPFYSIVGVINQVNPFALDGGTISQRDVKAA